MTLALKLPERLPPGFDLIRAETYFDVSEADFAGIREQAGFKKTESHGRLGDEVVIAGTTLALKGVLGVHDFRQNKDATKITKTGFAIHYAIDLEAGVPAIKENDGWDKLSDAMANVLAKHPTRVRLRQFFASGKIAPATSLPIPLGEAGIAGFTEIRGVRLAQVDPESKKILYSMILELTSDGGYGLNASTFIESRLDGEILTKAMNRLAEISAFAYKEVTAQ